MQLFDIVDPCLVGFTMDEYSVIESAGSVSVCVYLTCPHGKTNNITVEVYSDDTHSPLPLASMLNPLLKEIEYSNVMICYCYKHRSLQMVTSLVLNLSTQEGSSMIMNNKSVDSIKCR